MTKPARVRRALALLRRAFHWQKSHGHDAKAARIARAIHAIQDTATVKPKVITFPGVAAARAQSEQGGIPGDPHAANPGAGWCLMFVRLCYGIGKHYDRAIDAWRGAKVRHVTSDPFAPKRGYPVFFAPNHIAIAAGDGAIWTTDAKRNGFFDKVSIRSLEAEWGITMLGWTEDLNGEPVPAEKVA